MAAHMCKRKKHCSISPNETHDDRRGPDVSHGRTDGNRLHINLPNPAVINNSPRKAWASVWALLFSQSSGESIDKQPTLCCLNSCDSIDATV